MWTDSAESEFQIQVWEETKQACRLATLLTLVFFPTFSLLDWLSHSDQIVVLTQIRFVAELCFWLMYFLICRRKKSWNPYFWSAFLLTVGIFSVSCMTLVLDGYKCSYFGGVNLLILGGGLLFPWDAKRMAKFVVWAWLLYFVPVLLQVRFHIDDLPLFINNASFVIGTGAIAIVSAHLSYKRRRISFWRYLQAKEAKIRAANSSRAEDQAKLALSLRDEFISIASHELKTPITVLKLQNDLFTRFVDQNRFTDEHSAIFNQHLSRSHFQLGNLIRLIDDMLDISRISSGKMDFNPELVDLNDVLVDLIDRLKVKFEEAKIEVNTDFRDSIVFRVDRGRLEQVLMNLFTNAMKYAPAKKIHVILHKENEKIVIQVRDEGPGIPEAIREKVFERFSRGNSDHHVAGLGLGLYIAKQIILGMDGDIVLDTKMKNGTCFRISLPILLDF